jgi:hypothetical protein
MLGHPHIGMSASGQRHDRTVQPRSLFVLLHVVLDRFKDIDPPRWLGGHHDRQRLLGTLDRPRQEAVW